MKWITLTSVNTGRLVYVNLDLVQMIVPFEKGGSVIFFSDRKEDTEDVFQETPSQIFNISKIEPLWWDGK